MSDTDVVVTGIGLVTPLGIGAAQTWAGLVEGRSAIGPITSFDPRRLHTRIGAEVQDFRPRDFADRRALRLMTREDQFAVAGATLAIDDSGLDLDEVAPEGRALFIGGQKAVSDLSKMAEAMLEGRGEDGVLDRDAFVAKGLPLLPPLFYVEGLQAAGLFYISSKYGMTGANCYFHGTADAGATAIGRGMRALQHGEAEVAVVGGYDVGSGWWNMTRFDGMGVMTERNDLGAAAIRPFDAERDGTVMGEGAAFVVLETADHARARGARVYAALRGFGGGHDAGGQLTPDPDARGLVAALRYSLADAGVGTDQVDYVATHGGGTIKGDASENVGLRNVFGADAERLVCSSVKPATGHLVAGAGALNAAVAALAIHHGVVPPTLNLDTPDPACDLDYTPGAAREMTVDTAIAICRGLEGQNVVLTFTRGG